MKSYLPWKVMNKKFAESQASNAVVFLPQTRQDPLIRQDLSSICCINTSGWQTCNLRRLKEEIGSYKVSSDCLFSYFFSFGTQGKKKILSRWARSLLSKSKFTAVLHTTFFEKSYCVSCMQLLRILSTNEEARNSENREMDRHSLLFHDIANDKSVNV